MDLEKEIKQIATQTAQEEISKIPPVVFPTSIEVSNFPEPKAPIVNVAPPVVNVPAPIVNVPKADAPIVNVTVPDFPTIPEPKVTINLDKLEKNINSLGEILQDIKKEVSKDKSIIVGSSSWKPVVTSIDSNRGVESTANKTNTPLGSSETYTGTGEQNNYPDVLVVCKTDADGTLYAEFSLDGTNWDSSITININSGVSETHRFVKGKRYFRLRLVNGSSAQTYLRLSSYYGSFGVLTSGLSSPVQQDADAITTRTISDELAISQGLFTGYSIVNKFGRNTDIDTGAVPEDVWNGGGVYTGFPTGTPEELQVFSSSAGDTGTLTFTYLASSTSTTWQTATVTLQGTTQVNTGITVYRMHTANYSSGSATGFNLGTITARHRTTTANVFIIIPIGSSQSNVSAYTIPAGYTGYITRLFARVFVGSITGSGTGSIEGGLWVRSLNDSPRVRRRFIASYADNFEEFPYGGLVLSAGTDVIVRVINVSANDTQVVSGYDLILVKNT